MLIKFYKSFYLSQLLFIVIYSYTSIAAQKLKETWRYPYAYSLINLTTQKLLMYAQVYLQATQKLNVKHKSALQMWQKMEPKI